MADEHQDAFCWEGTRGSATATASAAEASAPIAVPAAPARRSRGWLAAGAAVLVAGGVAAALLLSGGSSPTQTVLARAADVTSLAPGYHVSLTMNVSAAGQSIAVNADGRFNTQPTNGTLTMTVAGQQLNEIVDGPYAYVQVPSVSSRWDRFDLSSLKASTSSSGVDVQQTIAFLRTVGTVTTVGGDVIDGVPTTHYHAQVDVSRLAALLPLQNSSTSSGIAAIEQAVGSGGLPLDVWLDAQSRVRQLTMSVTAAQFSLSMTMKLEDYGPQAPVSPPPADQVQDLSSLAGPAVAD